MTLAALARKLPADLQIVLADVGSAGGIHKRWEPVRRHVKTALFDPFDPQTDTAQDRYFPYALARGAGNATLHVTRRETMTSMLKPNSEFLSRFWDKPDHTQIKSSLAVQTDSLDHLMAESGMSLDVIKIDVQGFEYEVLMGAATCLNQSIFLAEIEVSFFERYVGLRPFEDIVDLMRGHGFELIDIGRIKRYRYRNSSGVVNPGLGMGDRAGRIAFCDALFMLNDELLRDRILAGNSLSGPNLGLKAIMALLVYGKADIAAWLFESAAESMELGARLPLKKYLNSLGGRHFGPRGFHRVLDYLARKV